MSKQYPGGLITKSPITPSGPYETSTASGIWTLDQQAYWRKLNQWPIAGSVVPDPQFNYVTMLLHGDGTNGAQNNTFLDSSTNNFTITRNGNTTQGSFSPYGSNWSNNFNGSSYLTFSPSTSFAFGTGDFTIEFWINTGGVNADGAVLDSTTNGSYWAIRFNGTTLYYQSASGITNLATPTISTLSQAVWTHVAIVRASGTTKIYANGVQVSSTADSTNYTATTTYQIGKSSDNAFYTGYFSNIRVVKGTAVYTGAFTPSTTALTAISGTSLLTCQANRFFDASSNAFALTANGTPSVQRFNPFGTSTAYSTSVIGGSGYFDGSGDYLSVANATALQIGATDFTVEGWFYTTTSSSATIVSKFNPDTFFISQGTSNFEVFLYTSAGTVTLYSAVSKPPMLQWNHFALERNSGNYEFYLNGVRVAQTAVANNLNSNSGAVTIGVLNGGTDYFYGYISDVRIVKGTAVYSGATYTIPTAPLTAITNTSLLTSMTNGAIFDNAMINDLETVGNAQISTSVKKYGTGSMSFERTTSSYLVANNKSGIFSFGTGDFTVEAWVYLNTMPTAVGYPDNYWIVGGGPSNSNSGFDISIGSTDLVVNLVSFASPNILVTHGMTTATWYHIAVTRSGSTLYAFKDGSVLATASVTGVTANPCLTGLAISAAEPVGATLGNFNGYIDDLRITKGYARYTATFTPPTAAFPDIGPT